MLNTLNNLIPIKTFTKLFVPFALNYYNCKNINNLDSNIKIYNDSFDKIFNYNNNMTLKIIEEQNNDYFILKSFLKFNYKIDNEEQIFEEQIRIFKNNNYFDVSYVLRNNSKIITEVYNFDNNIKKNKLFCKLRIYQYINHNYIKEKNSIILYNNIINDIYQNNLINIE